MSSLDLIRFRQKFKWTQSECARRLGCSVHSISNWERGIVAIPDSIALAVAAVAYDLPPYGSKKND